MMPNMQQAISGHASGLILASICQQLHLLPTKLEESLEASQFRVLKESSNIKN
jgi:hypothetical protein